MIDGDEIRGARRNCVFLGKAVLILPSGFHIDRSLCHYSEDDDALPSIP